MIITYLKENNQFMLRIDGFPELKEEDNKLWMKHKNSWIVVNNNLAISGYKAYPEQKVTLPYDDEGMELPVSLEELNLRDFTQEELLERQKPSLEQRVSALETEVVEIKKIRIR